MASKEAEALIQKYGGGWAVDRANAEQIRQDAKAAGTWGVQQNSTLAYTPPKVVVPEEKKTAADKMWDRNSQPQKIETTTRAKNKFKQAQKEYDDYIASDEYKKRQEELIEKRRQEEIANLVKTNVNLNPIRDEKEERLRAARDQAEAEYNASEDQKIIEQDLEAITGLSEEERRQLEAYAVGRVQDQNQTLELQGIAPTAQQEAAGLIQKYGRQRVDELAETYMRQQNAELARQVDEQARQQANEHGFWSSLATIPVNALGGVVGAVGQLQGMARRTGRYQTLDPNEVGTIGGTYSGAVRGQVQQNIEGEDPNLLRKAASIGYQGVMSAADSIARAYLGGGALGGAALAATGSFSQTMAEASERGATPAQAALLATTTAGIEALSEKIPLDNLIRTAKGGSQTVMQMVKSALLQAGIEATTEEISLLGTVLADAAIMQEKSEYQLSITSKIMQGISPEQARDMADQELINEAVNTALVSMVSGGMSSLGGSAVAKYQQNRAEATANPAVNKPKKGDVIKSRDALMQKYGQQKQATETFNSEQDRETAPKSILTALENQQKDDQWSDKVAPFRAADVEAIKADPAAMQWLAERGMDGDLNEVLNNVQSGKYQLVQPQTEAQPVQKTDGELVQETVANIVRQKQASEAQTEQAPTQTQLEVQTETAQQQPQTENTAQEQPVMARQDGTQQTDTQTAPDTTIPVQNEQSAEGGQQQEQQATPPEMQRDRINAVREQAIPVTDPQGGKVSEFAGNAYQSSLTPDSFTDSIKRLVDEGQVSHDVQTNEESLRKGAAMIAKAGTERQAVNVVRDYANSGKTSPEHIAMATVLYQDLTAQLDEQTKSGKVDPNVQQDAEDVFVSLQQMATNSGRALQLYNLFRKMSPDSQVRVMKNEVQRNIEKMKNAGTVKKDYQASIDPQLENMYREAAQEFQKAKGAESKRAAEQKMQDIQSVIYAEEAAKLPTTFKAKWDAWRYMAMLGNAKTQFRNILGNSAMVPYTAAKRKIGALLEAATIRDKSKRTKSFSQDKGLLEWAKNDRDTDYINKTLRDSAKLVDSKGGNPLQDDVKTFGNWELLNKLQKKIGDVTSWGDMIFKNREYAVSLAGFLKARGYTGADIQSNSVPVEVLNEARNYAVNEALRATFNDSNQLSDWFSSIGRKDDSNIFGKATNLLLEGVIPFRKTPANVLARGWEYSPMGIITTAINTGKDIHNGEYSAATAIDRLSANLTGSMLFVLGYALAGGIGNMKLRGGDVDEDETRRGMQNNAIEVTIGGETYSYTIDWLAPSNLPLLMGANLRESQEDPDTSSFITACMDVGLNTLEPMLELSCLSGLNDFLESARYAEEGETLYTLISKAATSYFTQGIPSLARQATQAANEYKQTTFATSGDEVTISTQKTIAGLGVGNPYKTDKINAWGEKEYMGDGVTRAVNAFLNPGTLKKIDNSEVEQEITRLNKATDENVTPPYISKVITYTDSNGDLHKDYRLSEEEYTKIATTQGQTARRIIETMLDSKNYQAMSDSEKAKAIKQVYAFAREKGMVENIEGHTGYSESWMMEMREGKESEEILRRITNSELNRTMTNLDSAWDNGYNTEARSRELAAAYDSYSKMTAAQKREIRDFATGTTAKYIEAREKGISHDNFLKTAKAINNAKGTGAYNEKTGKNTVREIDKRKIIAQSGLSEKDIDRMMMVYMEDYDPNKKGSETSELKYNYIRQELGLSPSEYVKAYEVDLKGGKWRDIRKGIQDALGCDWATANSLLLIFEGQKKSTLVNWYNS
jgi:hypothetical protein